MNSKESAEIIFKKQCVRNSIGYKRMKIMILKLPHTHQLNTEKEKYVLKMIHANHVPSLKRKKI